MFDISLILWFSSKRRSERWRWRWRKRKRGKRGNGRFEDDSIECKSFTKHKYKAEHSDETLKGLQKVPFTRKCRIGLNIGRVFLSVLSVWFLSRVSCLMTCLISLQNVISNVSQNACLKHQTMLWDTRSIAGINSLKPEESRVCRICVNNLWI